MTAEEIYAGESDNVEFKEGIPAKIVKKFRRWMVRNIQCWLKYKHYEM